MPLSHPDHAGVARRLAARWRDWIGGPRRDYCDRADPGIRAGKWPAGLLFGGMPQTKPDTIWPTTPIAERPRDGATKVA